MASKFQSRLIGTIILVAVGVIVLPDILDGKKLHYKEEFASIPIKPQLGNDSAHFQMEEPVKENIKLPDSPVKAVTTQDTDDKNSTGSVKASAASKTMPVAIESVAEDNQYKDSAWIIQLMALRNEENAINMVKDLQKRGYQAHTKKESGFTRVIIGPDVSKSKLERQINELEKITGSKGQLLKFKPLNP